MKRNNCIISYNVNGYCPVNKAISYEQKVRDSAKDIRNTYGLPLLIMLQEVLAGHNMKFLNLLRYLYTEYELILPAGFDYVKHYKSLISITLIRRDALGSYRVVELDSELPNRLCYAIANLNGVETHIINTHVIQVQNFKHQADWYICERQRLHSQQWDILYDVLHNNNENNVVFAGNMQERKDSAHLSKIKEDGYIISGVSGTKTVGNSFFNGGESCIDHIILSPGAKAALGGKTEMIYDNSGFGKYSDHTLLCLFS